MSDLIANNIHNAWDSGTQNWNLRIDASQAGMDEKGRETFERDLGTWLFRNYPKLKLTAASKP